MRPGWLVLVALQALVWPRGGGAGLLDLLPTGNATVVVVVLRQPWPAVLGVQNHTSAPPNISMIPSFGPVKMSTTIWPEQAERLAFDIVGNVSYDAATYDVRIVLGGGTSLVANATGSTLSSDAWQLKSRISSIPDLGGVPNGGQLPNGQLPVYSPNEGESPEPPPPADIVPGQQWIHWVMSGSLAAFTAPRQLEFRRFVGSFISRPSWAVALVDLQAGSIVVTLRLDGYSTESEETSAIALLQSSCTRAAPGYGIKCDTFRVTPAGESVTYSEAGGGITIGIITAIIGSLLVLFTCLGCAAVLLRRQKGLIGDEGEICRTLFTQETLVEGLPIETVELQARSEEDCNAAHIRV
eukprot:EG_transcript_17383